MSKSLYDYCRETGNVHILRQWSAEKNAPLTPKDVVLGTLKEVWWVCEKGHEWQARIASRTNGSTGCPVCTGKVVISGENDFASVFPDIAEQWHPTETGTLRPEDVTPYSNKKVWWLCGCGHSYRAIVSDRAKGKGCPFCAGRKIWVGFNDLATREPELADQWHPELNGDLTPEMVTRSSHKYVWWQCPEGHVWKARIASRTGKNPSGCPICAGRVKESRQERYNALESKERI